MLYHTSLTVIQDGFIVISKNGKYGLEIKVEVWRSVGLLCMDWHCTDDCLFVCLLILRLTKCPSLGHLGIFHLKEVADSPGSLMAFLVTATFRSWIPLAVAFPSEGNSKEEDGSIWPDFDDCWTCALVSSLKTPEAAALQGPVQALKFRSIQNQWPLLKVLTSNAMVSHSV